MPYVYRVETEEGFGPYVGGEYIDLSFEGDGSHVPTPENDGLGFIEPHEHCAFASLTDLVIWFCEEKNLDTLELYEFRVVKFYVAPSKIRYGFRQVVVVPRDRKGNAVKRVVIDWPRVRKHHKKLGTAKIDKKGS